MSTTRIRGLDELQRKLRAVADALGKGAEEASAKGADRIASGARSRVAVLTATTQASIDVTSDGAKARVVAGGAARYLESGTRNMPARPFLGPAAAEAEGQIPAVASDALKAAINRAL